MSWQLSKEERDEVLQRLTQNISDISFFHHGKKEGVLNMDEARTIATAVEKKAYAAAQVASTTTTGARPKEEVIQSYTRKLAELSLEAVKSKDAQKLSKDLQSQGDAEGAAAEVSVLDLTGGRDFLTAENVEDFLGPLLADGSKLTKVKFSTKSFGVEAAQIAAKGLVNVQGTLHHADLSDIIAGRPEAEALEVLKIMTEALVHAKLHSLNISDNALGEKGIRACAAALTSQPGLQSLSLQNIGCSVHACKAVDELVQTCSELRQLHLFNNMSDNEGAAHIANLLSRATKMEDFKMASSRVAEAGGISLAKALTAGTSLLKLELSDNPLTSGVADSLAALIKSQPKLQVLNLNDTCLESEGVTIVCQALQNSAPDLQELELALNEINPTCATYVALAVVNKSKLKRLVLRENEMKDAGVIQICQAVSKSCPDLQDLDIVQNQVTRVGAVAAAKACAGKANLKLLALDDNYISEDGIEEVRQILADAGKEEALGPLDENDPDGEADEDEEEGDDEATEQLQQLLAGTSL